MVKNEIGEQLHMHFVQYHRWQIMLIIIVFFYWLIVSRTPDTEKFRA